MINNQIPKINQLPQNFYQMQYMPNDTPQFTRQPNQFHLPISINPTFIPPQNIQCSYLPLLFPDQFLYPNQPYYFPRVFLPPQHNQINALNQLMICQNILNDNKNINNNILNGQKLNIMNKENLIENNCYNNNNYLNNNAISNEKEKKENEKDMINQLPKKFVIVHEKNKIEKKNILNINNEKINISENNNIDLNLLNKNKEIINKDFEQQNLIKINEKANENKENKENKTKLSLFTISNIKINTNINNGVNNNILNTNKNNQYMKIENNLIQNSNNQIELKNNLNKKEIIKV